MNDVTNATTAAYVVESMDVAFIVRRRRTPADRFTEWGTADWVEFFRFGPWDTETIPIQMGGFVIMHT